MQRSSRPFRLWNELQQYCFTLGIPSKWQRSRRGKILVHCVNWEQLSSSLLWLPKPPVSWAWEGRICWISISWWHLPWETPQESHRIRLNSSNSLIRKAKICWFSKGLFRTVIKFAPLCALAVSIAWKTLESRIREGFVWLHCSPGSSPVLFQGAAATHRRRVAVEMLEKISWRREWAKSENSVWMSLPVDLSNTFIMTPVNRPQRET